MKHIYYATSNNAKFAEAKSFLASTNHDLIIEQLPIDIHEIQSDDHDDILMHKIKYVSDTTNRPFIVDDASFYTDRFPGFPGAYAKFLNKTLGHEGWKKLFNDGDKILAVARIALFSFGKVQYFSGHINGYLHFDDALDENAFSLNDHIVVDDGRVLRDALVDPTFLNHRRKALIQLSESLSADSIACKDKKREIGERWSKRAKIWNSVIKNKESYANYERNYERVNALIQKYAPLATGYALEIGCGTGEAGRILKTSNHNLELLSTDISAGMLAEASDQTTKAGINIDYKIIDITSDDLGDRKFGIIISRGVVVSHLPKSDVYDFLESAAYHTEINGYLLFDFIQDTKIGEIEKPIDSKNEFKLAQMDEIMSHFDMKRIDDSGNDDMRVRVVCYQHLNSEKE